MATKEKDTDYKEAKEAFESLGIEDKAVFLMDAVFSTVLKGVEEFSTAVSDAVDDIVDRRHSETGENGRSAGSEEEPAKKKTARKRTSRKTTAKKAARKKPAAKKKTTARKSTSTRKPKDQSDE